MDRFQRAVDRNLHEVTQALREHEVLSKIDAYGKEYEIWGLSFFSVAYYALFNSMMGHVSKILDGHRDSVGFWYLVRENKALIEQLKSYSADKIEFLHDLSDRLKKVRDKTLFHIDKNAVFDPKEVWHEANIRGKQLRRGLDDLYEILFEVCTDSFKANKFDMKNYAAEDVTILLDYARQEELCVFSKTG